MKLTILLTIFSAISAQTLSPKCTKPDYDFIPPTYAKGQAIDIQKLIQAVKDKNAEIAKHEPGMEIIDDEALIEKYGEKLVEKIEAIFGGVVGVI